VDFGGKFTPTHSFYKSKVFFKEKDELGQRGGPTR